ncbi:hypothetical protein AAMO2058_000148500 [Amorphochlora amoebiformis]
MFTFSSVCISFLLRIGIGVGVVRAGRNDRIYLKRGPINRVSQWLGERYPIGGNSRQYGQLPARLGPRAMDWTSFELTWRCPCCHADIQPQHNINSHLMVCMNSEMRTELRTAPAPKIQATLDVITKLPLHARISFMESLYRLSRLSGGRGGMGLAFPIVSSCDREVLKLLFQRRNFQGAEVSDSMSESPSERRTLRPSRKRGRESGRQPTKARASRGGRRSKRKRVFEPDLDLEIGDSYSSPLSSPSSKTMIDSDDEKVEREVLDSARQCIDESIIREIIFRIEPSYEARH